MAFFPFIKNALCTVDGATASDEVTLVEFIPTVNSVTFSPISGNSINDSTLGGWVCNLTYGQDWETPASLSHLLHDSFGEDMVLTFAPKGGTGKWTVTVGGVPGKIGGAAGVAEATVALPCRAKPVWSAT